MFSRTHMFFFSNHYYYGCFIYWACSFDRCSMTSGSTYARNINKGGILFVGSTTNRDKSGTFLYNGLLRWQYNIIIFFLDQAFFSCVCVCLCGSIHALLSSRNMLRNIFLILCCINKNLIAPTEISGLWKHTHYLVLP